MGERNSFLVPHSIKELMEDLSMEEKGELFTCMMCYSMGEDLPPVSRFATIAFKSIKPYMDADIEKYKSVCEARKEAGRRGAMQRIANMANASSDEANQANAKFASEDLANQAKFKFNIDLKEKDTPIGVSKEKAQKRFSPPTLEEVKAYIADHKYPVDAERWFDYYTANGWKVGKNPMKDWKAAIRTWTKGDRERWGSGQQAVARTAPNKFHNYQQRGTDYDALLAANDPFRSAT